MTHCRSSWKEPTLFGVLLRCRACCLSLSAAAASHPQVPPMHCAVRVQTVGGPSRIRELRSGCSFPAASFLQLPPSFPARITNLTCPARPSENNGVRVSHRPWGHSKDAVAKVVSAIWVIDTRSAPSSFFSLSVSRKSSSSDAIGSMLGAVSMLVATASADSGRFRQRKQNGVSGLRVGVTACTLPLGLHRRQYYCDLGSLGEGVNILW